MHSLQSQKFFQQWRITWTKIWVAVFLFALSVAPLAARHNFRTQAAGQTAPEHLAAIAYYSVKGDWDSILTLNNSANEAVNAAIVLYSLEGKSQKLPEVTINAHNNTSVRLSDLLANGSDKEQFQEGSLEVHFNSTNGMAIAPQLTVTDAKHGLSFDMESPMHFKSARLDSLWWSLDEKTDGQIMLCNTTTQNLDVKAAVEWQGGVLPVFTVPLSPHQTLVLEIEKLLKDLRIQSKGIESGGISITHSGAPGELIAHGFVRNKERRFASNLNFVDPAAQKIARLDATGVLLGHPANSPLPEQSFFTPKLTVKNDSETSQTVTARVRYSASGKPENRTVPAITLAPHEVRTIDLRLTPSLRNATIEGGAVSVEHTGEPGSIIALLCSVDEAQGLAVDAPFFSRRDNSGEGGNHPFVIDEQTRSVVYLTNITDKATKVAVIVFHDGGLFTPELMTVAPGQTLTLDLQQMRDSQRKDVQGRVLPPNVSRGQISWSPRGGAALIGRVVMLNRTGNTASNFSYPCCCIQEFYRFEITPNPLGGSPGSTQQMTVMEWDQYSGTYNIGPYNVTSSCDYSCNNMSVVTVNSTGMLSFINPGSTTVQLSMEYWHSEPISAEDCGLVQLTAYDSAPVAAVQVTFQKADGTALPNPFRVGISATTLGGTPHDRKQGLRLQVVPAAEANNVSLSVSNRLNKLGVSVNTTTGIITFNVVGTAKSVDRGDASITARYGGNPDGTTAPVSVVVPNQIATPHDTTGGGLIIENRALNSATSPAVIDVPPSQFALKTIYMRFLTITIKDQFGDLIGDIYENAEITERYPNTVSVFTINQYLTTSSTYADPVGKFEGTTVVNAGDPSISSWPSQQKVALTSDSGTQNISVYVDGFKLSPDPAISSRMVTVVGGGTTSPPVSVTITW